MCADQSTRTCTHLSPVARPRSSACTNSPPSSIGAFAQGAMRHWRCSTTRPCSPCCRRPGAIPAGPFSGPGVPRWVECANNAHRRARGAVLVGAFGVPGRRWCHEQATGRRSGGSARRGHRREVATGWSPPALLARRGGLLIAAAVATVTIGLSAPRHHGGHQGARLPPRYLHEEGYSGQRRFGCRACCRRHRRAGLAAALLALLAFGLVGAGAVVPGRGRGAAGRRHVLDRGTERALYACWWWPSPCFGNAGMARGRPRISGFTTGISSALATSDATAAYLPAAAWCWRVGEPGGRSVAAGLKPRIHGERVPARRSAPFSVGCRRDHRDHVG